MHSPSKNHVSRDKQSEVIMHSRQKEKKRNSHANWQIASPV